MSWLVGLGGVEVGWLWTKDARRARGVAWGRVSKTKRWSVVAAQDSNGVRGSNWRIWRARSSLMTAQRDVGG